uniref:Methyltransferase n=1 Tax=candidate division CPR3 bacterium TaxID=2268181 RepID=A0A7C5YR69_UNCC3
MDKLLWEIDKLHEWDKNPRTISKENFERLKNQIKELGEYKPLIITKDGTVLGGNMRLKAYRELEYKKVWVSIVEANTEEEKIKYALSDNDQLGEYQKDDLANLVGSFPDLDLSNFTIQLDKPKPLGELIDEFKEVVGDEVPEVEESEPKSKHGEIYQLGRHRLMCGDATKMEDVEKLMDGKKVDITFHSPPYNVGHNLGYKKDSKYINDTDNKADYLDLLTKSLENSLDNSRYTFINLQFLENNKRDLATFLYLNLDYFVDIAYWKKSQVAPAMAKNVMNSQVEIILIFSKENNNRAIRTATFKRGSLSKFIETNSASGENKESKIHNATFPIKFVSHFIKNFSKDSVLDLFGGTGSTLIACEQTNRICYMMEIDPHYCDVIRKRYANFIGKKDQWETITPKI